MERLGGRRDVPRETKAPDYDGTTDVMRFLRTFHEVAELNQWPDEVSALKLKLALKGTAADHLQGETYEEMIESLRNRFEMTPEEARRALKRQKMAPGQDVHVHADRIMKLVRLAEPALDDEQRDDRATQELVDSIGDRHLVREFRLQGAINFADAVRRIQQYNTDMKTTAMRRMELGLEDDTTKLSKLETRIQQIELGMTELKTNLQSMGKEVAELVVQGVNKALKQQELTRTPGNSQNRGRAYRPPNNYYPQERQYSRLPNTNRPKRWNQGNGGGPE